MSKRPDLSADSNWQIAQIKSLAILQVDVNKQKPVQEVHEWAIFEHLNAHCSALSSDSSEMWILKLESYFFWTLFVFPIAIYMLKCPSFVHVYIFSTTRYGKYSCQKYLES